MNNWSSPNFKSSSNFKFVALIILVLYIEQPAAMYIWSASIYWLAFNIGVSPVFRNSMSPLSFTRLELNCRKSSLFLLMIFKHSPIHCGYNQSSLSTNVMNSPFAWFMPVFRAALTPAFCL